LKYSVIIIITLHILPPEVLYCKGVATNSHLISFYFIGSRGGRGSREQGAGGASKYTKPLSEV
jgi:hypothetical protein